jgi:hypothetical protein
MGVKLAAASGGSIELVPTNTASAFTVTVPAVTGTMLTNATTTGFPAGSVLQVVNAATSTQVSISSASYTDTGLTATITPTSATSKILVLVSQSGVNGTAASNGVNVQLLRGASSISVFAIAMAYATGDILATASVCYLDSPATTSATTYKTQFARYTGSSAVRTQENGSMSTITLMEIAA